MRQRPASVFLSAEWRHLVMLNHPVEPRALQPFVPAGTELDRWNGQTLVSVVGFLFLRTRIRGVPIPLHRNFEEVNLRFYVRRKAVDGWRRGVVFIKEIVPRAAIALVARRLYHEPYVALPMNHRIERGEGRVLFAEYGWSLRRRLNSLRVTTRGDAQPLVPGSDAEFITEHYWGYNAQPDGSTLEYRVEHPPWRVQEVSAAALDCDAAELYGPAFAEALAGPPSSALLAEGSAVKVYSGTRVTP